MTLQANVVTAARGWIGTRFHHQGRLKKCASHKGGVDCLGLLVGVANELNLHSESGRKLTSYDERDYPHAPDHVRLRHMLSGLMDEISMQDIQMGDIALFNIDGYPQHLGIITPIGDGKGIIHAYAPAKAVVEHYLDDWWQERVAAVFRLKP